MEKTIQIAFNEKKTINALLYIAERVDRKDFHKIFKLLYFADRDHLYKYGRPISGDTYIRMKNGPVPSKLYDILKSIRGDSFFTYEGEFAKHLKVSGWDLIENVEPANLKTLSNSDRACLDENIEKYGKLSMGQLTDISHDYAWNNTPSNKPIKVEDMMREVGEDENDIAYLQEQSLLRF